MVFSKLAMFDFENDKLTGPSSTHQLWLTSNYREIISDIAILTKLVCYHHTRSALWVLSQAIVRRQKYEKSLHIPIGLSWL